VRAGEFITGSIRLVRQLGEGGMGSVWLAEHLTLHTQVAVKFVMTSLADNPEAQARFEREASLAAQAKSPHVVQIFDFGQTPEGATYIVMELLEGEDLAARIRRGGPLDGAEFVDLFRQAASGIGRAHSKGIVHRDLKPENIFLAEDDGQILVKVLDFGIAKSETSLAPLSATATGAVLGTGYYMSPEQSTASRSIDFRTDLWSLGVVTYYALTGTRPFEADSWGGLVLAVNSRTFAPPSERNPMLSKSLDRWMAKALAHSPADRFQSAKSMAEELRFSLSEVQTTRGSVSTAEPASPQPAATGTSAARPTDPNVAEPSLHNTTLSPAISAARSPSQAHTLSKKKYLPLGAALAVLVSAAVGWKVSQRPVSSLELGTTRSQTSGPEAPSSEAPSSKVPARQVGTVPGNAVSPPNTLAPTPPQRFEPLGRLRSTKAPSPHAPSPHAPSPHAPNSTAKSDAPRSAATQPNVDAERETPAPRGPPVSRPTTPKRSSPLEMPFE
jgi:eukaryotic-like serine/threonine-protein kinase